MVQHLSTLENIEIYNMYKQWQFDHSPIIVGDINSKMLTNGDITTLTKGPKHIELPRHLPIYELQLYVEIKHV